MKSLNSIALCGRNDFGYFNKNLNEFAFRRENQISLKEPVKKISSAYDFSNSRSYSS
jgi:uncharacterized protein (DUF927 family)